jgi:hypothetical protein
LAFFATEEIASANDESAPPTMPTTFCSPTSRSALCCAPCGLGSSSQTISAGRPSRVLLRCSSASMPPWARYSDWSTIDPVLAQIIPILIGSAAAALPMKGMPRRVAANPVANPDAPSSRLRRAIFAAFGAVVFSVISSSLEKPVVLVGAGGRGAAAPLGRRIARLEFSSNIQF